MELIKQSLIKKLDIQGDSQNPSIMLDKQRNSFEFRGISIPDNAEIFYSSVIRWLQEYKKDPNSLTEVVFNFDFISPDSSKMITQIMEILQEIHTNGNNVAVKWLHHIDDEDIRLEGRDYSSFYSFPIELINYKN